MLQLLNKVNSICIIKIEKGKLFERIGTQSYGSKPLLEW